MFAVLNKIPTFVLEAREIHGVCATHTASLNMAEFPTCIPRMFACFNFGGLRSLFIYITTRTNMKQANVCRGAKYSNTSANIILTRDVETDIARTSITYSLGWGDGKLQGNSLTYHELWALSRLIDRVLRMDARAPRSCASFRGVTSTTYQLGKQARTERLHLCGGNLIPEIN